MKITAMISVIPIGVGTSLSRFVAACEKVFEEEGLDRSLHAHGTNVEGEWEVVMGAVRRCIETVESMGAPRTSVLLKIGRRAAEDRSMADMVRSVEDKLREEIP